MLGKLSLRFLVTRSHNNLHLFQFEIKGTMHWFIFGLVKSYRKCRQTQREEKKKDKAERISVLVRKDTVPKIQHKSTKCLHN